MQLPDYRVFGKRLGRLQLSGFYSDEESKSLDYRLTQKVAPGGENLRNRLYISEENGWSLPDGIIGTNYTQAAGGAGVPAINTVWEEGNLAGDRNDRANQNTALSFVAHALLFDEMVSLIAGRREDEAISESFDPGAESRLATKYATNTFGAVVHLNNWLSVFANYGENFSPDGSGRIGMDGERIAENVGESNDFGLRFSLLERKLSGTLTFYETNQINQIRNSLGDIINDFDDVWDSIEYTYATLTPAEIAAAGLPASAPARPTDDATALYSNNNAENNGNPGAIFADTLDSSSEGVEFELVANLTEGWRLSWSVSRHYSTVSAARKGETPYYQEHLPTWQQYVNPANTIVGPDTTYIQNDFKNQTLATMLATIANQFDETGVEVGGQRYGNREWSSNLVTRYSFREGWLKGWNLGGSVRWRDQGLVGYAVVPSTGFRDPTRPFYATDFWTMDAFIGYNTKIMQKRVTWDTNLRFRDFNRSDVWTTIAAAVDSEGYTGEMLPTRRILMAPISVELTSSFRW